MTCEPNRAVLSSPYLMIRLQWVVAVVLVEDHYFIPDCLTVVGVGRRCRESDMGGTEHEQYHVLEGRG